MSDNDKLMEKIRLLLAKAEGTDNEHEADVFLAKAQELMTDSAITEAMIRAAKPHDSRERPIQRSWEVPNPYCNQKADLLMEILRAQSARTVWTPPTRWHKGATVYGIGFSSDLELADGLYTSLLAQMVRQVTKVKPGPDDMDYVPVDRYGERCAERYAWHYEQRPVSTRLYRVNWAEGFATHVGQRLQEAAKLREGQAEQGAGGDSVALALLDRNKEIEDFYKQLYPKLGTYRGRRRSSSAGYGEGREAGGRADIGNRSFGGSRKALGA